MKIKIALFALFLPSILFSQSLDQEIVPIGTGKGVLMAYNFPHSHFTIRIEGDNVRPANRPYVFLVDNRALALTTVDLRDVNFSNCRDESDSLRAHEKYELNYLEGLTSKKLAVGGQKIKNNRSQTFLFWHYSMPPEMNVQLEHQFYITTIIGSKLLMLNTGGTKIEKVSDLENWLEKFAFTLITYNNTIDIQKLMDQIKKE